MNSRLACSYSPNYESTIVRSWPALYKISFPTERSVFPHTTTFTDRVSIIWSTGKIPPSFRKTTVRPAVSVSVNIIPYSHRLVVAFIKLSHAVAGFYMFVFVFNDRKACALISSRNDPSWETAITAGFELDVLRGKRPYRWTIWVSALYYAEPRRPQCR
jgi:hypothetical protein